jgi:hypothetical protein
VVVLGRRKIRHKVEAENPRPMEVGHSRGPGEPVVQPATFYSPKKLGEKGVVVRVFAIRLLPDTPTFEPTLTYEQEDR